MLAALANKRNISKKGKKLSNNVCYRARGKGGMLMDSDEAPPPHHIPKQASPA